MTNTQSLISIILVLPPLDRDIFDFDHVYFSGKESSQCFTGFNSQKKSILNNSLKTHQNEYLKKKT